MTLDEHANRVRYLSGLAGALGRRGEHTGDLTSLDEAAEHLQEVMERTPTGHPNRPDRLSSFATTTLIRMQHASPDPGRLGAAITALREAVRIAPKTHVHRAIFMSNLGTLLERLHEQDHNPDILAEAASWHRAAVAATLPDHSDRGKYLSNLAGALAATARLVSDVTVADEAIQQAEAALDGLPETGPAHARALLVLGAAHASRFDLAGDRDSLNAALGALRQAASDGAAPAIVRIKAGHDAGHMAAQAGAVDEAMQAFGSAVGLLDELAWTGISRADQERLIGQLNGLPGDAAAMAIKSGRLERAVELLEQGRGVLLGRALDMPAQYLSLRERAPDLAEQLSDVQQALDVHAAPGLVPAEGWPHGPEELQSIADRRSQLARQRDELLAQVQARPDLADVVAPPRFPSLVTAAADGPVIIVNVSVYGCDALLVTTDGVRLVALPGLTAEAAAAQATALLTATDAAVARELNPVLSWTWDSITEPVFSALGLTSRPPTGQQHPHLWWCATGITAFLPLHAAGPYDTSGMTSADTALDLAVSSYTPTLRTLIRLRERSADPIFLQAGPVIIAMPVTPDAPNLDAADREVEDLTQRFASHTLLSGPAATRAAVTAALPGHPWAHFSCHGTQNTLDPSAGRLILHDGPLEIQQIAALRLTGASFAYLSACDTYRGGTDIPDEGITLASALQLAGYQHVIATLWQISGLFVSDVSRRIYDQITIQTSRAVAIDAGGSAAALRMAISDLRAESPDVPPMYWAAFVHTGP
jgi:tetratricopeptide (TPR) repeat protein